jgi:hypothetical protein
LKCRAQSGRRLSQQIEIGLQADKTQGLASPGQVDVESLVFASFPGALYGANWLHYLHVSSTRTQYSFKLATGMGGFNALRSKSMRARGLS